MGLIKDYKKHKTNRIYKFFSFWSYDGHFGVENIFDITMISTTMLMEMLAFIGMTISFNMNTKFIY